MCRDDLQEMFGAEAFSTVGHALIDLLATNLAQDIRAERNVLAWMDPVTAAQNWPVIKPESSMDADQLLSYLGKHILSANLHVHHPRNLGHQVAPPLPLAALCDLVASISNQAMAVYETGPSATMIERQVISRMAGLVGWETGEGVLTSGGAMANLTALLAARQVMARHDVWREGVATAHMTILASEHAHYSVSRAAGIMGLGTNAVIAVPADASGSMDVAALESAWRNSLARGEQPFVVVATAGCTPTGSIDPLSAIGEFCQQQRLWFHVDGAHGASGLLSASQRPALAGIELADSLTWDGHKLLYMPATVSAVLFKERKHSYAAFAQQASYLFQGDCDEAEAYNTSYRTLECTKRMMGLKLWATFVVYGTDKLGGLVEHVYATAHQFASMLAIAHDFELLMQPQTNIVCFRFVDASAGDSSAHQSAIRRVLVESGAFHITQTKIHDEIWLRTTIMNPFTQVSDLQALLDEIRRIAPSVRPIN